MMNIDKLTPLVSKTIDFFCSKATPTIGAIILAVIPASATYFYAKDQDLSMKINQEKISRYEKLITSIDRGFITSRRDTSEIENYKREFYENTYIVWLYAPDSVISALNEFTATFSTWDAHGAPKNDTSVNEALGQLILAMRKDVYGKTALKSNELITVTVR